MLRRVGLDVIRVQTAANLAREAIALLTDWERIERARRDCARLRERLGVGGPSPSDRIAEEILALYREIGKGTSG